MKLWAPTIGKQCGIGEYTQSLTQALQRRGITVALTNEKDGNLLHFQHEYSFLPEENIADFFDSRDEPVVITMHTACNNPDYHRKLFSRVRRVIVHHPTFQSLLECPEAVVIPMGCDPVLPIDGAQIITLKHQLGLQDAYPLIGSFGFLRPQKGYVELLLAIRRLAATYPKIAALIVSPRHVGGEHYEDEFLMLVRRMGMANHVVLYREWQPIEQTIRVLQCADLLVLNYIQQPMGVGISAAAKTCLRTQRPLIVSDTMYFIDLDQEVAKTLSPLPEHVAPVMQQLLDDLHAQQHLQEQAKQFLVRNAWDRIAARHAEVYDHVEDECLVP